MNWQTVEKIVSENSVAHRDEYLESAERLLTDDFIFDQVYNMEPCPERYHLTDWHKSPNGDPEWLFVLKRQEYLQDLIYAYLYRKDKKYLSKVKYYIFEWISNNYNEESVRYSTWRTIDTGIRLLNWAPAINLLSKKNLLTDVEKKYLKRVVNDQSQYLKNNYIEKYDLSNWGILITTGILTFNAVNQGLIEKELINWASNRFTTEIQVQVDDDGMHWEQSPLYFVEVFRSALCVYASYKQAKLLVPVGLKCVLEKMLSAFEYQMDLNGYLLQQGDTDAVCTTDLFESAWNIIHGSLLDGKLDFLTSMFLYHNNFEKSVNNFNETFDAFSSGNFFKKNKSDYIHVFNGNLGSGHGHASNGHIDLMVNREHLLVDPGRYTYVNSKIRKELKSGGSHNVVMIDNEFPVIPKDSWKFSAVSIPLANEVQHRDNVDVYKTVTSDSENEQYRVRYTIWLNQFDTAVVIDVIRAKGQHLVTSNWILAQGIKVTVNKNEVELCTESDKYALITAKNNKLKAEEQIYSARYNEKVKTKKIEVTNKFEDYYVNYTVIGNIDNIKELSIRQADSKETVSPEYCYALRITQGTQQIDLVLQHLNTFVGNKLYYVEKTPIYGEFNIIDEKGTHRIL